MCIGPDVPKPEPLPPPPAVTDAAAEEARRKELIAADKAKGRQASLLTGGAGAQQTQLQKAALLGG
jgi:hypothetical protein